MTTQQREDSDSGIGFDIVEEIVRSKDVDSQSAMRSSGSHDQDTHMLLDIEWSGIQKAPERCIGGSEPAVFWPGDYRLEDLPEYECGHLEEQLTDVYGLRAESLMRNRQRNVSEIE